MVFKIVNSQINNKNNKRIQILFDCLSSEYIRVEEEENNKIYMLANYFYLIIPKENITKINEYERILNQSLINKNDKLQIIESNCPRIYKLYILPPTNINLFDFAWELSEQLNLGPFPEYINNIY